MHSAQLLVLRKSQCDIAKLLEVPKAYVTKLTWKRGSGQEKNLGTVKIHKMTVDICQP